MHARKRTSKTLFVSIVAVLAAALVIAGCGGSSGGGGEPAGVAPKGAPVYIEANLAPDAKTSEALDELTQTFFGIEDVGDFAAEELEKAALGEGQKFNFEKEVEPWLGEKAGLYLAGYDGENFNGYGIAVETTDTGEAEEFIEKRVKANGNGTKSAEFKGHKYYIEPEDESVLGMIGDFIAFGETKTEFEEMVEASEGEGLNESPKFKSAMEAAPDEGIADLYVDIGGVIEEAKGTIPPESEAFFDLIGIEPRKATAVASVVPRSEQVEIDFSTTLGKTVANTGGDASKLLESMPGGALVGFASAEFGKSFGEGLNELSENGIPGQVEPGELAPALEAFGLKLESVGKSFGDAAGFVEGTSKADVGGALVIETSDPGEARNLVSHIALLLRASKTEGVTAISGNLTGFSVRSPSLGKQPLIVGAGGEKIVIAYGARAAAKAIQGGAATLGSSQDFQAGKSALGSTPIAAFVDGGPTLKLVESLISPEEQAKFGEARPYLRKIAYLAIGSEAKDQTTTAKVIVGFQK